MAKLLVQESAGVREFELIDKEINIGRELDNSLRLSDPSISRHHAVIRRTEAGHEVQDLQSSNGVLLNGTRVGGATLLKDGDRVTLGQMQITFSDPGSQTTLDPSTAENPVGTVRMNPADMARLQGRAAPAGASAPDSHEPATGAHAALEPTAAPGPVPEMDAGKGDGGLLGWFRRLFRR